MITVTKLNDQQIIVNADLIEFIEPTPDTMISTTTGKKIFVKESVDEIIQRVVLYKKKFSLPTHSAKRRKA